MTDFPDLKIKALVSFPANILDGTGIDVAKQNGAYQFNLAYDDFAPPVAGVSDPSHQNILLWNSLTQAYALTPISLIGGGGGIPDAVSDSKVYGRQNAAWVDVQASPAFTGTPTAPTAVPATNTTQLATTAFVTAAVTASGGVTPSALTRTNDANVTLTLGGTPGTALLQATNITAGWNGTLAAGRGGTGMASYAVGDLIYASAATTLANLADVATGNALVSGGVATAPSWGKIGLTTHVSGALPAANGGFGANVSASSGVPLFATGAATFTATTGTGNLVCANNPAFTANVTATGIFSTTAKGSVFGAAAGTGASGAVTVADANIVLYGAAANWAGIGADPSGNMWFRVGTTGAPAPAMYIDAAAQVVNFSAVIKPGGYACRAGTSGTYSGNIFNLEYGGATALWINAVNTGNITVSSDYRIKKDVLDLPGMWETVKALRPIKYTQAEYSPPAHLAYVEQMKVEGKSISDKPMFPADDIERWGFIAHELQETLTPSAANGVKDAPDEIQSPNPFTVIAALTRALQEAMTRIEALEAK